MSTAALGHAIARRVHLERAVYGAAALGLTVAPNAAPWGTANLAMLATAALPAGVAAVRAWKKAENPDAGLLTTLMRALPCASAAAVDITALCTTGWATDAALAGGWAISMAVLAPFSRTGNLRLAHEALRQLEAPAPEHQADPADEFTRQIAAMWERAGSPGETELRRIEHHPGSSIDFSALLKAPDGKAVPRLDERTIGAAFGVPPETVTFIAAVHGADGTPWGPGWGEIIVTPDAHRRATAAGPSDADWWAKNIARPGKAIPGAFFDYKTRDAERGVTHWVAQMEDETEAPRPDLAKLCTALGADPDELRVFAHVEGHRVHVMVCDEPPLVAVRHATRADVTPDPQGFWRLGVAYDGSYVRGRVHRPEGIALGLTAGASGSGKSQLIVLNVAAAANAGMINWVATEAPDGKIALLAPHVDRHGVGPLFMYRMLRAAVALMDIRGAMPRADGTVRDWKPNDPGCPYSALTVEADEYLAATKDEKYGERITILGELLSVKGRKYAMAFKPAGQDMKVEDGFTSTMRNQLKANSRPVILNMGDAAATRRAFDGLVASEWIPDPLPGEYGGTRLTIEQRIAGEEAPEDASGIGGVGWIVIKGRPILMRALYVDLSGHDAERNLAALFPDTVQHLTPYEIQKLDELGLLGDWNAPDLDDEDEGSDEDWDGDSGTRRRKPKAAKAGAKTGTQRKVPTAADRVASFLDMLPDADRQMVIDAVTGDGVTAEAAAAAYAAHTHT
ncbi:chromosome segregation protein ParM [Streptomyces racemochromogenes]|uniref:chromosome segregation protein ParM n=1 Tax=Streptomyces racemochromogenes TaxID=67353 RepID=UPI0031ED5FF8